jgi:hypothetical protein
MSWARQSVRPARCSTVLLALASVTLSAGCSSRQGPEAPLAQRLSAEVRAVLGMNRPSADYHRERTRLQEMGPDLDVILIGLIGDTRARPEARADALILLADRRSPLALPTLESALQSEDERLRSAAVLGLNRLVATTPVAVDLIRQATYDRSRTVRLNALQSLDIREVETIREVLAREVDGEVRKVGLQLIALGEARGAPLAPDFRGTLRTAAGEGEAQIVFRPFTIDSTTAVSRGDLRIELPALRDIPLAASAIVVGNVLPAFFSPNRSHVVFEADGEIGVVDIMNRTARKYGTGIAPRPIPFTKKFVFFRPTTAQPVRGPEGTRIDYNVYMASFDDEAVERIGELTAWSKPEVHGGESPVRWMVVVDEITDGLLLKGENMDPFPLPARIWTTLPTAGSVPNPGAGR